MENIGRSLKHHDKREDLAGEHPYGDIGQIIGLVLFLVLWIIDSLVLRFSTILAGYIPLYVRLILAGLTFGLAGYLAWSAHEILFREVRDPPQVVSTGVFSCVRHPLYLAALLLYVGFFFTTLSLISLLCLAGLSLFYNFIAAFEERELEKKFGQEYLDYEKNVPKWFPLLKSRSAGR
jgi:protein-S-isoprenylcysteine O-methyltransferase Ste14